MQRNRVVINYLTVDEARKVNNQQLPSYVNLKIVRMTEDTEDMEEIGNMEDNSDIENMEDTKDTGDIVEWKMHTKETVNLDTEEWKMHTEAAVSLKDLMKLSGMRDSITITKKLPKDNGQYV